MEPNANNYSKPLELPPLQEVTSGNETQNQVISSPETTGQTISPGVQSVTKPAVSSAPSGVGPLPVLTPDPSISGMDDSSTATLVADDTDLIEKEWVAKAKNIVMQTKNDPHQQTQKLSVVKADYLKKRYNKEIKVSEN